LFMLSLVIHHLFTHSSFVYSLSLCLLIGKGLKSLICSYYSSQLGISKNPAHEDDKTTTEQLMDTE
jgi:hypothetical protein